MAKVNRGRELRLDQNMNKINGVEAIIDILNLDVNNSTWTAVQLPNTLGVACKTVVAKLRAGGAWKISHESDGSTYLTVASDISINLVQDKNATLFYAQSAAASGVLEVMLLD